VRFSERDTTAADRRSRLATNSAEAMAALRAAGSAARDPVLRNPEFMAADFLSVRLNARLLPALAERLLPGGYYYEAARVKHIDGILQTELEDGLDQLLILGAGYDSRPYRFADALERVRVYEVDLPSISVVKRRETTRIVVGQPYGFAAIAHARVSRGPISDSH
jgi:O-methyltransferase involved in polyketide biosynthesis